MNVAELSEAQAFSEGADLWIIKNEPQNKWWQEIDFRSGFLLSHCLYHHKKPVATKVNEILEVTGFPRSHFIQDTDLLLIGSSDHFLNKWILVWDKETSSVNDMLLQISKSLNFKSVRFFSDSDSLLKSLKSGPKTSLADISFIKNT